MKISNNFVMREIAGDYVIVPIGSEVLDFNGLIMVNEVGAFLWEGLQQELSVEELTRKVLDEYEVDEKNAREDIESFLLKLQKKGIIV